MNTSAIRRGLALSAVTALAASGVALLAPVASAAPGALGLVATSNDGVAFDLDEHDPNDISVQVADAGGAGVDVDDAQDLAYHWTITPFDGTAPVVRVPATGSDVQPAETNGKFVVPMPSQQVAGSYVLVAELGPDSQGGNAMAGRTVLTVKAGNAELALDESPLRAPAGEDVPVAGRLSLEDGTGLPGRLIDLGLVRGTAGNDPAADAGFVPDPATGPLVTSREATTGADGAFTVVVSDPAEAGQGTELGGVVSADTGATPGVGDAGAGTQLDLDFVSEAPPAGSTLVVSDLGSGTPGLPLAGQVSVTAPDDTFDSDAAPGFQGDGDTDRDPVVGQLYTLDIDHGFFSSGREKLPAVAGEPAGNLESLGDSLTGLTDADGEVALNAAIERDAGFDDDGRVTATVTATAGGLSGTSHAAWDTAGTLNGGEVRIVLSPPSEQDAAVNPALEGNRTWYDVFTVDQFGNPLDLQTVDIAYSGDVDNFDYNADSVTSDFDRAGDLWVVSFQPGAIKLTGTWDAPTYLYDDATGAATAGASALVGGSATASFYELDFDRSTFSVSSSPSGVVEVGTAVTETVRVLDQRGNPVRGYRVDFFRAGPDAAGNGEPRATRVTNAQGRAFYTFVGGSVGRARISVQVSDGLRIHNLTDLVAFGAPVNARLTGANNGRAADALTVTTPRAAAGARVTLFKLVHGRRVAVATRRVDATGRARFSVRDRNRGRATTYVADVRATAATVADTSNTRRVR